MKLRTIFPFLLLSAVITLLLASGCSTFVGSRYQKSDMMVSYTSARYDKAEREALANLEKRTGTTDELMWLLECGYIEFVMEDYHGSLEKFERAEELIKEYDRRAAISLRDVASEIGAAYTNQNALPYKGYYYERIIINLYKALDYYALGEPEAARVEMQRVRELQKMLELKFNDEIYERVPKKVIMENNEQFSSEQFTANESVVEDSRVIGKFSNTALNNILNPAALYLSAAAYLSEDDFSEAMIDLRKLYNADNNSQLAQRLYETCSQKLGDKSGIKAQPYSFPLDRKCVYVIFENGLSPARAERIIHLVLPPPVGYTGFAYPVLEYYPENIRNLEFFDIDGKKLASTETLSNMENIVSASLQDEFSKIISRAIVSMTVKEATSISLQMAASQMPYVGPFAQWSIFAMASIYKYAANRADTRCWQTLPKEYQAAIIPLPDNGIINFSLIGDDGEKIESASVNLGQSDNVFLLGMKSNGFNTFSIKVFKLKKD